MKITMAMRTIRIRTRAPATPPTTGPTMLEDGWVGGDDAVVVVGGDAEPAVKNVPEPLVGGAVGGAVGGKVVGGPVVVGGVVVGGAVVGGTLGLGVGVTLTSGKGSIAVLPLPLAAIEVVLGRLVVVVRVGVIVGLGVVVGLAEADEMRMIVEMVFVWPGQERREKQETDSV